MKKIEKNINKIFLALIISFLFPLYSFAQFDFNNIIAEDISQMEFPYVVDFPTPDLDESRTPVISTEYKVVVKEWTIMTYINAKNDLEYSGLKDVNEMEQVGSTDKINIVVEIGRMNGQEDGDTHVDGDWTGTRRIYIKNRFSICFF